MTQQCDIRIQNRKVIIKGFQWLSSGKKELNMISLFFERKRFSKAEVSEKHSLTSPASEKEEIRDYAFYFAFLIVFISFFTPHFLKISVQFTEHRCIKCFRFDICQRACDRQILMLANMLRKIGHQESEKKSLRIFSPQVLYLKLVLVLGDG